jgi:hypothetical protein
MMYLGLPVTYIRWGSSHLCTGVTRTLCGEDGACLRCKGCLADSLTTTHILDLFTRAVGFISQQFVDLPP